MPMAVRPENIKLPKRRLKKDILYRFGLKEGEQIGLEEGLLKSTQEMVLSLIEGRLGYVPNKVTDFV